MTKLLLLMGIVFAGTVGLSIGSAIVAAIAVRRALPPERRAKIRERVSRAPGAVMERMMWRMPSGIRHLQEQNEELLALLREMAAHGKYGHNMDLASMPESKKQQLMAPIKQE